ncbi:MAG: hypothetical protein AB7F86_20395 [Bdellovibrionales bacterium]
MLALTANQAQDKVQTTTGSEAADAISPGITLGPHFDIGDGFRFAPQLGYIYNQVDSNDRYGGKYRVETFYLLYDFTLNADDAGSFRPRFGVGNFIKRITGKGGTVTVPNGFGTSTSNRPGGTKESFSTTLNLGFEWDFAKSDVASFFRAYGLAFEMFLFEPLDQQRRLIQLQLALAGQF